MAVVQALIALIGRSAGKILNAAFGWAVRALFGSTTGAENTLLTVLVAFAALWPLLLVGIFAPRVATYALTFVPVPDWISDRALRLTWVSLAAATPLILGVALGVKTLPEEAARESRVVRVLRGFPATLAIAIAFWITLLTVPFLRVIAIARGWRDVHVPLISKEDGYWDAASRTEAVLNERGFELEQTTAPAWVRVPMGVMRALGGAAMRRYVPERIAYFVGPRIRVTLHPSSLLLQGAEGPTTIAHGLVVEALASSDALQTTDPRAQEVELQIRRVWRVLEERPEARRGSAMLLSRLHDISEEVARLETSYDDWQTVYRQALQLGRALEGEAQLLELAEGVETSMRHREETFPSRPRVASELSTLELLAEITSKSGVLIKKEFELAQLELKGDLKAELSAAKGLSLAAVAALATLNLLLVAAVFGLTPYMAAWQAALALGGTMLLIAGIAAFLAKKWHVESPLALTRKTLVEDVHWAKEEMA